MPAAQSTGRLFRFLPPHRRLQGTDIAAVAGWTGVATATWLIQPFDWIKKTFLEKQEPEEGRSEA